VARQKLRRTITLVSFLLFPVTIYYLSPYLAVAAASEGLLSGSVVIFGLMFASSLVFGRAYCGWLCPACGIEEMCAAINPRPAKGGRRNWVKYAIWLPWVASVAWLAARAGALRVDMLYGTTGGISIGEPSAYFTYYAVLALVVVPGLVGGRFAFSHYLCWMAPFMVLGSHIRQVVNIPSLHLRAKPGKCTDCGRCTRECLMSLPVAEMVKRGAMYSSECILCGRCVDGCAHGALSYAWGKPR
jgi:ferredoxin-type protein NapH